MKDMAVAPDQADKTAFFTIASANYLAYAITLMQSVREQHPEASRYLILADKERPDLGLDPEIFTVVPVQVLDIPHFDHFALRYSILEFNTAIKPFAFRWLARRHRDAGIVYLDPDILVVSPLAAVFQAIKSGASAVLTPHLTEPMTDDKRPDELSIMRAGAYNLGFIGIGPHAIRRALIDWWADKLEFGARIEFEAGLFTDQKWMDLVPGLFPDVRILRHPGYNIAYWNLAQRPVRDKAGALTVGGQDVAFVHFSGVDVRHPERFSKYQNRFSADDIGQLRPLYDHYLGLLRSNGFERFVAIRFAWAKLDDGTVVTEEIRAMFRHRFDIGRSEEVSDPFAIPRTMFAQVVPPMSRFSRFALQQYPRIRTWGPIRWVLDAMGPQARWALRRAFHRRAALPGATAADAATAAMAESYAISRPTGAEFEPRANVVGYFKGEFGVAEAARSLVRAARSAGVDVALINVSAPQAGTEGDSDVTGLLGDVAPHSVNVFCVNADQTPFVMASLGARIVDHHYNIGVWFWELAKFPAEWDRAIAKVDEVWAASAFVQRSIAGATSKPVRKVPLAIDAVPTRTYRRDEFGLPEDSFTFLFGFDLNSYAARKNPLGLVDAFKQAFPRGDGRAALALKVSNARRDTRAFAELQAAIAADPRIHVIDRSLSRDEIIGLEQVCDAYVSLHRSEGFGLGLAESMALGKPVVGTAYSGNMEFMNAANSLLVGYQLVPVREGQYPHATGQLWAEPDVEQAVAHLRRLVDDRAFGVALGARGRADIERDFSPAAVGKLIAEELSRVLRLQGGL